MISYMKNLLILIFFVHCLKAEKSLLDINNSATGFSNLVLFQIIANGNSSSGIGSTDKIIFVTSTTFVGNLGGITGADLKCMNDANFPGTGIYKALLVDGVSRSSPLGSNVDWVLKPLYNYYNSGGALSFTANTQGIIPTGNLQNPIITSNARQIWTGLLADWTDATYTQNCQRWSMDDDGTSTLMGTVGRVGSSILSVSTTIFESSSIVCANAPANSKSLLCIEQ